MHLIYTRFWTKVMRDLGLVTFNEPVKSLLTQGMVVAETFYRVDHNGHKTYFNPADVDVTRDEKGRVVRAVLISDAAPVEVGSFEKMSKSVNNGVDPREMIAAYGADATRLFVLFAAPAENELRWSEAGVEGAVRFLRRVWTMVYRYAGVPPAEQAGGARTEFSDSARALRRKTHQTIARVTADFDKLDLNTNVAALMELSNAISEFNADPQTASPSDLFAVREALEAVVIMLAPFAPHAAEEMWEGLGHEGGLLKATVWPTADAELAKKDELEIPVQVNGKLRSRVVVAPDISDDDLRALALADSKVQGFIDGQKIVKVIVVPQRLVNVVVK
jgi:leucyl-tRNA synthetase